MLVHEDLGKREVVYGRKLQLEFGRFATSVNISEMRRCWTEVSWCC